MAYIYHAITDIASLKKERDDILVLYAVVEAVHPAVGGQEDLLPGRRYERLVILALGAVIGDREDGLDDHLLLVLHAVEADIAAAVVPGVHLVAPADELDEDEVLDDVLPLRPDRPARSEPAAVAHVDHEVLRLHSQLAHVAEFDGICAHDHPVVYHVLDVLHDGPLVGDVGVLPQGRQRGDRADIVEDVDGQP